MSALAVADAGRVAGWEEELRWHDEDRGDVSAGAAVYGAVKAFLLGTGAREPEWRAHRCATGALLAEAGLARSGWLGGSESQWMLSAGTWSCTAGCAAPAGCGGLRRGVRNNRWSRQ